MPRYLGFIKGVVDSDDLPLNVNRETLQESKIIKIIKKKLVRKAIDLIRKLSQQEMPEEEPEEAELDADGNVIVKEDKPKAVHPYITWYKKFGLSLKMGCLDDSANKDKLQKTTTMSAYRSTWTACQSGRRRFMSSPVNQ
jgi:heat shock protein beta